MDTNLVPAVTFGSRSDRVVAAIFAALAASVAALFVTAHWSIALAAGLLIFSLAFVENEFFLLTAIALLPLNWVIQTDLPIRDVLPIFRLIVVTGFFLGRLWRGSLDFRSFRSPITRASFLFGAVTFLSVPFASGGWTHESERELFRLASHLAFYLLILAWADSATRIRKIVLVLMASMIAVSLFAMAQEVAGGYTALWGYFNPVDQFYLDWAGRATSFLAYSNVLAGCLNIILPMALAFYILGQGSWKKWGGWTFGLGSVALLCTQSVGGLAAFAASLCLTVVCFVQNQTRRLLYLSGIIFTGLAFYAAREILNPAHVGSAFVYDAAGRFFLWTTAGTVFWQHPILGAGWGNFLGSYDAYIGVNFTGVQTMYSNNFYLDLLAGAGILGFVSFVSLSVLVVRDALDAMRSSLDFFDRALAFGVLGAMFTALVHGLVDDVIVVSPQAATLLWVMLALLVSNTRLKAPAPSPALVPSGSPQGQVAYRV
jgi:O-antigen ligase